MIARHGRPNGAAALLLCAAAACQITNRIDACDRGSGLERQVNARTDGDQTLQNTRALVALPSGKAMVAFSSAPAPAGSSSEIRGGFVNAAGVTLGTCSAAAETTWAPHDDPTAPPKLRLRPTLARPVGTDDHLVLAYAEGAAGSQTFQVFAQELDGNGCPMGAPVQVSAEPAGMTTSWLQVVPTGMRQYVVIWGALDQPSITGTPHPIRARAIEAGSIPGQEITFLPTSASRAGDVVDLPNSTSLYYTLAAAERGDGGVLLAWIESTVSKNRVRLASFNEVLDLEADTVVSEADGSATPVDHIGIDVASDGEQALVVWAEHDASDASGRARVFGRFFTPSDLDPMRAPQAPNGEQFRLGSTLTAVDEGYPSLAVAPDGGFVATWNESGDPSRADTSGASIRALLIGADGGPQFANLACDRRDFQLNTGAQSDQLHPTAVFVADGSLLTGWTDLGGNGTDRSTDTLGAGVRIVALPPHLVRPDR
jgi:hypothetical protein